MKKAFLYGVLLLTINFLFSCKSTKKMENFTDDDLRFSLSKGICFGSCPVYELKVYHGGYATYLGTQNTDRIGLFEKTIAKDEFKQLEKAFEKLDFDSFPDEFKSNIPDLPMIKIGYHNEKTFRIVSGKEDRPEDLMQAQFMLEKIADNKNWTLVKNAEELNKNKKPEPSFIYNEIIIEPRKGLLLTKWLESKSEYGVRLIKKIAPNLDFYLIGYNTETLNPNAFLDMLHKDKDIKSAEFNKKVTQRSR